MDNKYNAMHLTDEEISLLEADEKPAGSLWLEELDLSTAMQGWGEAQAGKSLIGEPITIGGKIYKHGVGTHVPSKIIIYLNGAARDFIALVGIDDTRFKHGGQPSDGNAVFEAWVDGKLAARSSFHQGSGPAEPFKVDLAGAGELMLVVHDNGQGWHWGHVSWAGALLRLIPGASISDIRTPRAEPAETLPIASTPARTSRTPVLCGPPVIGATPGKPFLFKTGALGERDLAFSATGLPPGLSLDPHTGIISGSLAKKGCFTVQIKVWNDHGEDRRDLTIIGGNDALAQTPPMGWNSWNVWGLDLDEKKIREAADALVETGLADLGYVYVNIDDGWQGERGPNGVIRVNERFGDMRKLADYIHQKGLKFGIYSSPGPLTCGGYTGSYRHEEIDAKTWAAWGVDYIKYDWCSYSKIAREKPTLAQRKKPYQLLGDIFRRLDRDIIYSICQYGEGKVWEWGREVGGHLWRVSGDITDTWSSMFNIAYMTAKLSVQSRPGAWNDPDMMVVGWLGWGSNLHYTRLTQNEQITHLTLWCMLAAPLLLGCDLTRLDEWTLDLIGNPEVIAVDQDWPSGPVRIIKDSELTGSNSQVWVKPLSDGSYAVAFVNPGFTHEEVAVSWASLGLKDKALVRDLWQRLDLGEFTEGYTATVPPHGSRMFKVRPAY